MIRRTEGSFHPFSLSSQRSALRANVTPESPSLFQANASQAHRTDLFCFQFCSSWSLSLRAIKSKKELSFSAFLGALSQPMNSMKALLHSGPPDIRGYLPIDLAKNQRFVLDRTQPRMNLSMQFDLSGRINHFTTIGFDYSLLLFDIQLTGDLHGMNLLKEPIEFTVKGDDIKKSISDVLNEKRVNLSHIISRDEVNTVFNATVFSNIQCSFSIEFIVSNQDIATYQLAMAKASLEIMKSGFNMVSTCSIGIIIKQLTIIYYLPMCVFAYMNYKGFTQFQPISPQMLSQMRLTHLNQLDSQPGCRWTALSPSLDVSKLSLRKYSLKKNKDHCDKCIGQSVSIDFNGNQERNFCNWILFMTNTTPIVYEEKLLLIKEILDSFIKPSLFGVKCVFKQEDSYTQVSYYPSLSSMLIIYPEDFTTELLDSTSTAPIKHNGSDHAPSTFYYEAKPNDFCQTLTEQLKAISTAHLAFNSKTISEISHTSWFSLTWTPSFNESKVNAALFSPFEVFYHFRSQTITQSAHFLPTAGVFNKVIYENTNKTASTLLNSFWFSNFLFKTDHTVLIQATLNNNKLFYTLVTQARKLKYSNGSF